MGNLTNVDYTGGSNSMTQIAFAYNGLNRLTNMTDTIGTTAFGAIQARLMRNTKNSGRILPCEAPATVWHSLGVRGGFGSDGQPDAGCRILRGRWRCLDPCGRGQVHCAGRIMRRPGRSRSPGPRERRFVTPL